MKRLFVVMILAFLGLLPRVLADGPDDQYVNIYNLIQMGDMYYEKGQLASARANYEDALSVLKRFNAANPDWNVKVVQFRLNYLTRRLAAIASESPAPKPAATAPKVTPTPAPAPAPAPVVVTPKPEVAAPLPQTPPPVAQTTAPPVVPKPTTPPVQPSAPTGNTDYPIIALQDQVRRLEGDKVMLEAKLKEALAARPAAVDPQEMARTQEMVKQLQKENELLKTSLSQAQSQLANGTSGSSEKIRQALAEANRKVEQLKDANDKLAREKEALQVQVKALANPDAVTQALREENEILKKQVADLRSKSGTGVASEDLNRKLLEAQSQMAVLQSDKELLRLEKMALETRYKEMEQRTDAAVIDPATQKKVKQLEAQREELQKKLDAALAEIEGHRKGKDNTQRVEQMTQELATLHARIETLEAVRIPYTAEELALFQANTGMATARTNRAGGERSVKELPAEGALLISEAKRYYAAGDLERAETKYKQVLKLNEKNVSTLTDMAKIEVDMARYAEAEQHINAALAIDPNDDYSLTVLGQLKFQQNKYDEALDVLSRAAKLNPQNPEIQNLIGVTLSEKGLRGQAETALRRAVQIDPNYANAHINLAFVYLLQKPPLTELARWHYQKALAAHHPRNAKLEELLDPRRASNGSP